MATTSTIPAVCAGLRTAFAAAIPGVPIVEGRPPDSAIARTMAVIGDINGEKSNPVSQAGRKSRDERYSIEVAILVKPARGSTATARDAAVEIMDALDGVLADDVHLGDIDGVEHVTLTDFSLIAGQGAEGPICTINQTVRVVARLD